MRLWAALLLNLVAATRCGNMVTRFLQVQNEQATENTANTSGSGTKQRKLTFLNSGTGALSNFTVLVKLNASRIDYSLMQAGGANLRFYDSDATTALPFEIELWNSAGTSIVWVRVPQVDAGSASDHIWMRYGANPGTLAAGPAWDTNFENVYHMNNVNDSSTKANHATNTLVTFNATILGTAGNFNAAPAYLTIPVTGMTSSVGTVEALFTAQTAAIGASDYRFIFSHTTGGNDRIYLALKGTLAQEMVAIMEVLESLGATNFSMATTYYMALTWNGSSYTGYLNGIVSQNATYTNLPGLAGTARIGNYAGGGTTWGWNGAIDEVRVSSVVRTADYFAANQKSLADTFIVYGPEADF